MRGLAALVCPRQADMRWPQDPLAWSSLLPASSVSPEGPFRHSTREGGWAQLLWEHIHIQPQVRQLPRGYLGAAQGQYQCLGLWDAGKRPIQQ